MKEDLRLVLIDSVYCDYLRKYDARVAYNNADKETRPFIGALININGVKYFAPLASPKKKHLDPKMAKIRDFIRIDEGRLGGINLNNMIPVTDKNIEDVDLKIRATDNKNVKQYKILLINQLQWLVAHDEKIKDKTKLLYDLYIKDRLWESLKSRCCDWKLLEEKCKDYNEK